MLKTLKITSFFSVIAAAVAVVFLVVIALRGNPEAKAFFDRPGVVERFEDKVDAEGSEEDVSSPLVSQAKAFALRIDPPPPPAPPKPAVKPTPPKEVARSQPTVRPTPTPTPKVQVSNKFDVLATVKYESVPEKSLALLKTSGNKQEWFRQGERVGNLVITEIRDGSVIFSQGNRELPEAFVPAKPKVKSLLKNGETASPAVSQPITGTAVIQPQNPTSDSEPETSTDVQNVAELTREAVQARIRSTRTDTSTSQPGENVRTRIQRIRSVPRQPSPEERKESLENTLSGIENIMNRGSEDLSAEERQREEALWTELMEKIQAEKENVQDKIESNEESQDADVEPSSDDSDPNDS